MTKQALLDRRIRISNELKRLRARPGLRSASQIRYISKLSREYEQVEQQIEAMEEA